MKKLCVGILFLCLYSTVWSQITITKNDMPSSNNFARYSTSNTRLKFDTTGAGITWDYSTLAANGQGVDSFLSAFSINPAYALYFGLLDYGTRNTTFPTNPLIQLSNVYSFYKKTSSYLEINGFGGEYNSIPIPITYTIPDKVYQFPLTYGRTDTSAYDLNVAVPAVGGIHQVGTRINTVDGWGTVITPYGSFPCIRVMVTTQEVDTFTITALNLSLPFPRTTLTYQWLANGQIIPVLEVSGRSFGNTFMPNSEKFRDSVRSIPPQFAIHADFRANKLTCTTLDTVTITNRTRPNVPGSTYRYTITPSTYSFVSGTNDSMATPQLMFSAPGLYTVSLHVESPAGGTTPAISDTTKVEYITVTFPNGIEDVNAANGIEVYPNPVSDILIVRSSAVIKEATLINSRGQKVQSKFPGSQSLSIDVKAYEEGIYLLDIETATGHDVRKVVIQ